MIASEGPFSLEPCSCVFLQSWLSALELKQAQQHVDTEHLTCVLCTTKLRTRLDIMNSRVKSQVMAAMLWHTGSCADSVLKQRHLPTALHQ